MNIFGKKAIDKSLEVVNKLIPDADKKHEIASDIVNNELISGSKFVRNARPMVVYVGLFVILLEVFGIRLFIINSIGGEQLLKASNAMLEYFLFTWSGVISIYIGGRTFEKSKMRNMRKSKK